MNKLVYCGGALIQAAIIQPIFWGQEWNDPINKDSANKLASDLTQLIEGPYMRALFQYGGVKTASILLPVFDDSVEPPGTMTLLALSDFLKPLIGIGKILDFQDFNEQLLYFVFTLNRQYEVNTDGGIHYWSTFNSKPFYFAWSEDPNPQAASHEIVEACTDPDGKGWVTRSTEGSIEVADICQGKYGYSDGIFVEGYWSDRDSRCVVPARIANIILLKNEECPVPPSVGGQSTFTFTFGMDPDWIDSTNLPILTNLKYRWTFNPTVAKAQTPTDLPTLTLLWLTQPTEDVTIKLDILADKSISVLGSINVHIHTQLEGELAQRVCRLRQIINQVQRIPPFLINPLGPDNPELPTEHEIGHLDAFAKEVSRQVKEISNLRRRITNSC